MLGGLLVRGHDGVHTFDESIHALQLGLEHRLVEDRGRIIEYAAEEDAGKFPGDTVSDSAG